MYFFFSAWSLCCWFADLGFRAFMLAMRCSLAIFYWQRMRPQLDPVAVEERKKKEKFFPFARNKMRIFTVCFCNNWECNLLKIWRIWEREKNRSHHSTIVYVSPKWPKKIIFRNLRWVPRRQMREKRKPRRQEVLENPESVMRFRDYPTSAVPQDRRVNPWPQNPVTQLWLVISDKVRSSARARWLFFWTWGHDFCQIYPSVAFSIQ